MLSFWWDGTTLRVLNEKDREPFVTPEALSDYLVDFLEKSAFRATPHRIRDAVPGASGRLPSDGEPRRHGPS